MASSASTYNERLGLVNCFEECKEFLSQQHYELMIHEALEETQERAAKLKYILSLARRCKSGVLPASFVAEKIDKEYSVNPVPQTQDVGENGELVDGHEEVGTEMDEADYQNKEQQDDEEEGEEEGEEEEEEEEVPQVREGAKELVDRFEHGFFSKKRWSRACRTFFLPGEGYWLDPHRIQSFRKSTLEDFTRSTPRPMPVFIDGNPHRGKEPKQQFKLQEIGYHLCKKVAVSIDGEIYRATDREIQAALDATEGAPKTDAVTYIEAVQELRRRLTVKKVNGRVSGDVISEPKRRRVQVDT